MSEQPLDPTAAGGDLSEAEREALADRGRQVAKAAELAQSDEFEMRFALLREQTAAFGATWLTMRPETERPMRLRRRVARRARLALFSLDPFERALNGSQLDLRRLLPKGGALVAGGRGLLGAANAVFAALGLVVRELADQIRSGQAQQYDQVLEQGHRGQGDGRGIYLLVVHGRSPVVADREPQP